MLKVNHARISLTHVSNGHSSMGGIHCATSIIPTVHFVCTQMNVLITIQTLNYLNVFAWSQLVWIIEVALHLPLACHGSSEKTVVPSAAVLATSWKLACFLCVCVCVCVLCVCVRNESSYGRYTPMQLHIASQCHCKYCSWFNVFPFFVALWRQFLS